MSTSSAHTAFVEPKPSLVHVAHAVYALHAVSLGIGAFGASSVVGAFLFGWPSILAVILNYALRGDARGTWLESHFSWQIRTFWFAALWTALVAVTSLLLLIVIVGFGIWIVGMFVLGVWAISRVARGWLRLKNREPVPF
jgi:uncharacterized membrane protein